MTLTAGVTIFVASRRPPSPTSITFSSHSFRANWRKAIAVMNSKKLGRSSSPPRAASSPAIGPGASAVYPMISSSVRSRRFTRTRFARCAATRGCGEV